jgi:mycofactocin precursor
MTTPPSRVVVAGSAVRPKPGGSGVVFRSGAREIAVADPVVPLEATGTAVSWQPRKRLSYAWPRPRVEEAIVLAEERDVQEAEALADDDVDELLVEEISIDGMCGVY